MNQDEIKRLTVLETRIREMVVEMGLATTDIVFEIVPAQRVLEGMSYNFPTNFSHWSFGREYDRNRTIYQHTGAGIPYEQVWNTVPPKAFLVETNPFALNVMIVAHVYFHVDFFLSNDFCRKGGSVTDLAYEARRAAKDFVTYEDKHGKDVVENVIDAAMAIQWHQSPDTFHEEIDEEILREHLLDLERARLSFQDTDSQFKKPLTDQQIKEIEKKLEAISNKTPPRPTHDLLSYIINHAPKNHKPWVKDILTVVKNQARALTPMGKTKMLNEGWATYGHVMLTRRLCDEGLLTEEEHGIFNFYHSRVTRQSKTGFNWYGMGLAFYEYIKEKWDLGQHTREYEESEDPYKRTKFTNPARLGNEKILEIRSIYNDHMAIEELFTDEFIREQQLYIYTVQENEYDEEEYAVVEDDPKIIRNMLKSAFAGHSTPAITVEDGNYKNNRELYLRHHFSGYELDSNYRDGTLEKIWFLWGRKVHLETRVGDELKLFTFTGKNHTSELVG